MLNVNLKDSKTGHSPHSNPRDVGKSPKVAVRFKNWTHLISKKKTPHTVHRIIRDNWKNHQRNAQWKSSSLTQTSQAWNTPSIHPGNNASCFLAGMLLVKDIKMACKITFKFCFWANIWAYEDQAILRRLGTAGPKGSRFQPFLPRHNVKHTSYILKYGSIF